MVRVTKHESTCRIHHRDPKLLNLLVNLEGNVKILRHDLYQAVGGFQSSMAANTIGRLRNDLNMLEMYINKGMTK